MNIDEFVVDLLHIDDGNKNKLMDLGAGDRAASYYLTHSLQANPSAYLLEVIRKRFGKTGNTVMRGSAPEPESEQFLSLGANDVEWADGNGTRDPKLLDSFIKNAYGEINSKGINPIFLGVGAVRWRVPMSGETETKEILTPLLIFPVRLVRSVRTNPVVIEFIADDVYLNPCFTAKLKAVWGEEIAAGFPHPNGEGVAVDDSINLDKLGDGTEYFARVEAYAKKLLEAAREETLFRLERDVLALSRYNHDEICMYYDIRRNRKAIDEHPLIKRIFTMCPPQEDAEDGKKEPWYVLPRDSVQEEMIRKVVGGKSIIIKGPPGTGKTLTIANMIAALLSEGKTVLLASEKLAALSEVYAKLPEKLRPFAMLLDCETSAQAAKLNPSDVRRDFSSLLRARRSYQPAGNAVYGVLDRARKDSADAVREISSHVTRSFFTPVAGGSYFEALDAYSKNDLPAIGFAESGDAARITREEYHNLLASAVAAGGQFDLITDKGAHSFARCPWIPRYGTLEGRDTEGAFVRLRTLAANADRVVSDGKALFSPLGIECDGINVNDFVLTAESGFSGEELSAVCTLKREDVVRLSDALERYDGCDKTYTGAYALTPSKEAETLSARLDGCVTDETIAGRTLCVLYGHRELLSRLDEKGMHILTELAKEFQQFLSQAKEHEENYRKVFREDLTDGELRLAENFYPRLASYADAEKPRALDFGAKSAVKKLLPLCYLSDVTFREIVGAVCDVYARAELLREAEDIVSKLNRIFRCELKKEELEAVVLFGSFPAGRELIDAVSGEYELISACAERAARKRGDYTLRELKAVYRAAAAEYELEGALSALALGFGLHGAHMARTVCGVYRFASADAVRADAVRVMLAAEKADEKAVGNAKAFLSDLSAFGKEYFETYYTSPAGLNFRDLKVFAKEADDRNIAGAAAEYFKITRNEGNRLSLERFFRPFETGAKKKGEHSFADWFEHSLYALAVSYVQSDMGDARNGAGRRVALALDRYLAAEDTAAGASVSVVESKCMMRINPDDPDFAFLQAERGGAETLRRLFKQHGSAILKLKRCFLLSPPTVSVLFGAEEYANFDVVIVDEASQLEPTAILPVLFRAKQCVLVGDEWQMPPMKHFVTRTEKKLTDEDGEETTLEPEISVLSLALRNAAFPATALESHYRSKTEPLIAFSQKRYYQAMRTFPAPVPIAEGLGFTDVYVPDGWCKNGVNEREAVATVECLNKHFDRYFDKETGKLSRSVGVVAFGQEQTEKILSLVRADTSLSKKIDRALSNFSDVKEKLVFFKTIETVQGQETEHLILSLTYGRREDGKIVQAFGEMNRGGLGQCIFNVAVTRAQCAVTVVHSVTADQITNDKVSYIRDYLALVGKFSKGGREQFVSAPPEKGFLRSVGEYVVSLGIDEKRVVYNYGVTAGSVRIPIAVLSEDMNEAKLGIWCEFPFRTAGENYIDENAKRYRSLEERGWKLVRVYAHDWVDNPVAEREALASAVDKYVKE